jgi:hypothetical protein
MGHPNEEIVRRAFDAFAKGDTDTLRESMKSRRRLVGAGPQSALR